MQLTALLLTVCCLSVTARTVSQSITYNGKNVKLSTVFDVIRNQTGLYVLYNAEQVDDSKTVSIDASNLPLKDFLNKVLVNESLGFSIDNTTILIKKLTPHLGQKADMQGFNVVVNPPITGIIRDAEANPLSGVNIVVKGTKRGVVTDSQGKFSVNVNAGGTLVISSVGYISKEIKINEGHAPLIITLEKNVSQLSEVAVKVSSGYQEIEKGQATGSYAFVDNQLFNRKISTDILSRIDGVVPGVLFDKRVTPSSIPGQTKIQIRGLSTLTETNGVSQPLIVLDNFPYEGDLNDINPNDVENITVLRDAAAASVWGARAGNGVIVITTKKGRYNQPFAVSVNANITIAEKQKLDDIPRISSRDFVDLETMLFNNGFYEDDINYPLAPLSPVVDILLRRKNSEISPEDSASLLEQLRSSDNLNDIRNNYYRNEIKQQYAVSATGGSQKANYRFSVGYDKNLSSFKLNSYDRITIRSVNTFQPLKNFEASLSLGLTRANADNSTYDPNGFLLGNRSLPPYYRLVDENGNPTALNKYRNSFLDTVGGGQLLDWQYKPVADRNENSLTQQSDAVIVGLRLKYNITRNLLIEGNYQYQKTNEEDRVFYSAESFYVRDQVNLLTNLAESDLSRRYPIPKGAILDLSNNQIVSQSARAQINYNKSWRNNRLQFFAGSDVRKVQQLGNTTRHYGLDERLSEMHVDYITVFSTIIGGIANVLRGNKFYSRENRFVSYFANGELSVDKKYILTASAKKEASNVFGVTTNQKGRPFWSVGGSWIMSNETFYKSRILPDLRFRITYGFSGNIDPSVTAHTIIRYQSARFNTVTNVPYANLATLPNPNLRWEKVGQINAAIDFGFKNNRISGSLDFYQKRSTDILFNQAVDPTSGAPGIKSNSAEMLGKGIDFRLNLVSLQTKSLAIETNINLSYVTYKVTHISRLALSGYFVGTGETLFPREGYNPYVVAAYKWHGLDPTTGDPIGFINGKPGTNYDSIINYASTSDVIIAGPNLPKYHGNILNAIRVGHLSVSANITWQLGAYMMKPSILYGNLFSNNSMHPDYSKRWRKPGDERITSVPSLVYPYNGTRDYFYSFSEANLIKTDYFRLEDIRISYSLLKSTWKRLPFKSIDVVMYLNNLNVLIWRANNDDVDPLFPFGYRTPKSVAFGLKMDL